MSVTRPAGIGLEPSLTTLSYTPRSKGTKSCWDMSTEASTPSSVKGGAAPRLGTKSRMSVQRQKMKKKAQKALTGLASGMDKQQAKRMFKSEDMEFLERTGDRKEYRRRLKAKFLKAVKRKDTARMQELFDEAAEVHELKHLPCDEAMVACARTEAGEMHCVRMLLPWCHFRSFVKALQLGVDRREPGLIRLMLCEAKKSFNTHTLDTSWISPPTVTALRVAHKPTTSLVRARHFHTLRLVRCCM